MNRLEMNYGMLLVILALLGLGMVMVYSSSAVYALEQYGDSLFFTKRQGLFLVLVCLLIHHLGLCPFVLTYHTAKNQDVC